MSKNALYGTSTVLENAIGNSFGRGVLGGPLARMRPQRERFAWWSRQECEFAWATDMQK